MRRFLLLLILLLPGIALAQASDPLFGPGKGTTADFLPVEQAFAFDETRLDDGRIRLHWRISPGYYLYRDRLRVDGAQEAPELPRGETHEDAYFGTSTIYRDDLDVILQPGPGQSLQVSWQGCADAGLCYPPQHRSVALNADTSVRSAGVDDVAEDEGLAAQLQRSGFTSSLVLFFSFGLLLAFTPCSLPMLPILASVVVGSGARTWRSAVLAGSFVVSMALVYAAMGTLAAALGTNLQAWLQQPWLIGSFAALFVILALPMFGLFELQLPSALRQRLDAAGHQRKGGSVGGAAILGVLSGLMVGPCMTAPLAGALLYIAQSGDLLLGGAVLFALGMGMGVPLILVVLFGRRWLPRPGAWMDAVKALFGFLLLASAWVILRPLLDSTLWVALGGVLLLAFGWATLETGRSLPGRRAAAGAVGVTAMLWGAAMLLGAAGGAQNPLQPLTVYGATRSAALPASDAFVTLRTSAELDTQLQEAHARQQWVVLDYSADWCVSCKVIEQQVFNQPAVQEALKGARLLRLDVTADNADSRALLLRYRVPGPPSILWISPDGSERRGQRITGEISQEDFLALWHRARGNG
jgi:thiol:disulfide interchange protein DsbD